MFSGAGTDHLGVEDAKSIDDVIRAYEEQIAAVEKAGGRIILMASRALAKLGRSADDYGKVYNRVLSKVRDSDHHCSGHVRPGAAGVGYGKSPARIRGAIITPSGQVDGVKVSMLDKQARSTCGGGWTRS